MHSKLTLYLSWLFFISLGLGQLQRIFLGANIAIYAHDLIMALILLLNLNCAKVKHWLNLIKKKIKQFPNTSLLIIWGSVSLAYSSLIGQAQLTSFLYILRLFFYLCFILIKPIKKGHEKMALIPGLLIATLGLTQYLFFPDVRLLSQWGWDGHYFRLVSTMLDPNFAGIILTMTFLSLWPNSTQSNHKHQKFFLTLLVVSLALTFSRASYLSLAIGLGIFWLRAKNKKPVFKKILRYGLIVILIIFLAPKPGGEGVNLTRTSTIKARASHSSNFLQNLNFRKLIFGQGLFYKKKIEQSKPPQHHAHFPDNLLIFVFVGAGIPGIVLLLGAIKNWANYLTKSADANTSSFAILASVLLHSQFNHTLLEPIVFLTLLFLLMERRDVGKRKRRAGAKTKK